MSWPGWTKHTRGDCPLRGGESPFDTKIETSPTRDVQRMGRMGSWGEWSGVGAYQIFTRCLDGKYILSPAFTPNAE